jgi:outer membrane protein OmpA-like peptidoglycan-associated protein
MKNVVIYIFSFLFLISSTFSGCKSYKNASNYQKGAGIGAASGAVVGGLIGSKAGKGGHAVLGAVVGAMVGGAAGAVIGNEMDKQAREIKQVLPGAEVERVGEGIRLILKENAIRFDFDKSSLTSQAKTNLNKLATVFKENPNTNINIFGYTDNVGTQNYNLTLSKNRAKAVKNYLVSKGLGGKRMETQGLGMADPIASNETSGGRAQNRRVEFAITANEKMAKEAKEKANQ